MIRLAQSQCCKEVLQWIDSNVGLEAVFETKAVISSQWRPGKVAPGKKYKYRDGDEKKFSPVRNSFAIGTVDNHPVAAMIHPSE